MRTRHSARASPILQATNKHTALKHLHVLVILTSNFPYFLKYPLAINQSSVSSVETVQMKARAKSLPVPRKKV